MYYGFWFYVYMELMNMILSMSLCTYLLLVPFFQLFPFFYFSLSGFFGFQFVLLYFILLLFFRSLLFLFYSESLRVGFRGQERWGEGTGGSRGRKTMIRIYCKRIYFQWKKKKHFFFISTSLSMKEIQNKTALRFHLTRHIMVKIRETNTWK